MKDILKKHSTNILLFCVTFLVGFIIINIDNIIKNGNDFIFLKPLLIALGATIASFFGKKR